MFAINNERRLKAFTTLALTQLVFAAIVLTNEQGSIGNRVPGGNFPIEHQSSWERVWLFCGVAVVGAIVAGIFHLRKQLMVYLPSFISVLCLAVIPLIAGAGFSHYFSFAGWCCETPYGFFFGFPFSFLFGMAGFDRSLIQYSGLGFFEILKIPGLAIGWELLLYGFFLDFLFWSCIIFILLTLATYPILRGKTGHKSPNTLR